MSRHCTTIICQDRGGLNPHTHSLALTSAAWICRSLLTTLTLNMLRMLADPNSSYNRINAGRRRCAAQQAEFLPLRR